MKYKIVSDSSSDILALPQVPFASVPLHIIIGSHEFIDDKDVDLPLQHRLSQRGRLAEGLRGRRDRILRHDHQRPVRQLQLRHVGQEGV